MELARAAELFPAPDMSRLTEEPTEEDERIFRGLTSLELSAEERARIQKPEAVYPRETDVLAVHWHPEHVPMELIRRRIDAMFPARARELIIPTQHNELSTCGGHTGCEVDCYSAGFNQKVQLLVHMENRRLERAGVLSSMLRHTARYRATQLFEFLDVLTGRDDARLQAVAAETGAPDETIRFARLHAQKLSALLSRQAGDLPPAALKNRLVKDFLDAMRPLYGQRLVTRVQAFVQAVKLKVKAEFPLQYFYRASEVIEEARGLGAGVVIPHPEQFWPILLAGYDVDGFEVWTPQSQRYTDFLIDSLDRRNRKAGRGERRQLIFMGDDTHMSEKLRPEKAAQDMADPTGMAGREIGVQSAWDDLAVRKKLLASGMSRESVIEEYTARLAS